MVTLALDDTKQYLQERLRHDGRRMLVKQMRELQVAVYVMCGGGFWGRFAATQPARFYIDDRVGKKLPYSRRKISQAVNVLAAYAEILGLHHGLEWDADFPNVLKGIL